MLTLEAHFFLADQAANFLALHIDHITQVVHFTLAQLYPGTNRNAGRQENTAITNPLQTAHFNFLAFPQTTHFAVTTFHNHTVVPLVGTFTVEELNVGKTRHAVFQQHAFFQALNHWLVDVATNANRVFTVNACRRVHQLVGQLTVSGEQQQTTGVDIQSTDVNPALTLGFWQVVKHGWATFRVYP